MDEKDRLIAEIAAWEEQRNEAGARINWMFTTERARTKLARAYPDTAKSHKHCAEVLASRPHGRALLGEGERSLAGVFRGPHRVIDRRAALHCGTPEYAVRAIDWGFDMTTVSGDSPLLAAAAGASVAKFRQLVGRSSAKAEKGAY